MGARELADRIVLVTGGGRGIGRSIALALARHGAYVVVNYRSEERAAQETVTRIHAEGGSGRAFRADVGRAGEARAMIDALVEEHGRIDLLVNNAGIARDAPFALMRDEAWSQVLAVDLGGAVACAHAAAVHMAREGRGTIVNVGSGSSLSPRPFQANYASAKSALLALTRSLARELAPRGVRVALVAPGLTRTDMARAVPREAARAALELIPLQRFGMPEEIAEVVVFVASDAAGWFSGQVWVVDGGRTVVEAEHGTG